MPKVEINTYTSFDILADGTVVRVPVTKIVSEDEKVANISKQVNIFDKYSSKKNIAAKCKDVADVELAR